MIQVKLTSRKALAYAREGIDGGIWYDDIMHVLRSHYGADADIVAAMIAATSPNCSVRGNVTLARKAYGQYKRGEQFLGYLPIAIDNLHRAVDGEPLSGLKVSHFHRAITGDHNAVAVDRWMLRAYGVESNTPARMRAIIAHVRKSAKRLGITPRSLQAAIWTGVKGEGVEADSMAYCLRAQLAQMELI